MKLTIEIFPDARETGENLIRIARKVVAAIVPDLEFAEEGDKGGGAIEVTTGNSDQVSYLWDLKEGE